MQGDATVIELLNDVLTAELTSVNQYFLDAKMCANWGYDRLAEKFREESIGEMKDADALIERILYLEGMPEPATPRIGAGGGDGSREAATRARARAQRDRTAERGHRDVHRRSATTAPRELLDHILEGEEEHADWIETQLELIRQLGDAHYLAQQIRG